MQHVPWFWQSKKLAQEEKEVSGMDFSQNLNGEISAAVDECVNGLHAERNRAILKRSLIDGICYEPLAEEFDLSTQAVKKIVYKWRGKIYKYLNL